MAETWLVCAGAAQRGDAVRLVGALSPGAQTIACGEAAQARGLAATLDPPPSVAVGEGCAVDPVNLAAAVVADGRARRVVLVVRGATGSLVSRAARAGVVEVFGPREGVDAAPAADASAEGGLNETPAGRGGPPPAADDLDEPDDDGGNAPAAPPPAAPAAALAEGRAPVVTLVSARGGVGKSSIACLMALTAARWGMRTALVDLDLAFGNLFGFFGLAAPPDLAPAASAHDPDTLGRLGVPVAENLVLMGPCAQPELAETVEPRVAGLLGFLRERFDLVVVDTSAAWGDGAAQAAQAADRLCVVGDERAGAIGSLARAASLAVRLGVARTRIVRLMNRCDARRRDEEFMTRASLGLEGARTFRVLEGSLDVAELLSAGHAAELAALDNDLTRSSAAALARLLADLGRLPDCEEARRAKDAKVVRRRSVFSFAKAAG